MNETIESTETYTLKSLAEAAGRRKATALTNRGFPTAFLGTCPVRRDALSDDGFGNKTVTPGDIRWAYLISA